MNKIKPPAVKKGGTIGIPAPASKPPQRTITLGVERLRKMGFNVVLGRCLKKTIRDGFLAGSDSERADELNQMFGDDNIDAIICAQGGYGSIRLLKHLDYDLIKENPKIIMGMSDIVSLLLAIHKKTGLITFHGPGAAAHHFTPYTDECTFRALTSIEPLGIMKNPPDGPYIQTIEDGTAEGEITGGNLDLIVATLSTEYEIETKEKIFFFEAAGHRTWELDRILVHLELSGKLGEAAGFVAGQMLLCDPVDRAMMELMPYLVRMDPKEVMDHQFSSTVEEVLQERLSRFRVPAIYGLCCGHTEDQSVIPIGVRATLDGTEGLRIVESAVTT